MRRVAFAGLAAAGVLAVCGCGTSASARLSDDLIPAAALRSPAWGLRTASSGRVLNPFGVQPAGAPLPAATTARTEAVAVRQWVHGSGALAAGPLPDGIVSVIDRAAHFRTAGDAQALVTALSAGYGPGSPITGGVVLAGPFVAAARGGQVTGREDLVVIQRGTYVFTVLVVGGGSRPTAADAQTLAALQAAAIPPSIPASAA